MLNFTAGKVPVFELLPQSNVVLQNIVIISTYFNGIQVAVREKYKHIYIYYTKGIIVVIHVVVRESKNLTFT